MGSKVQLGYFDFEAICLLVRVDPEVDGNAAGSQPERRDRRPEGRGLEHFGIPKPFLRLFYIAGKVRRCQSSF